MRTKFGRRFATVAVAVAMASAVAVPVSAVAAQPPSGPATLVSLGDSYISGEAGRWQGNANPTNLLGDRWGTDRAAYDCVWDYSWCSHDARRVYGASYDNGCDRSDVAEIRSAPVPIVNRVNLACSGAETVNIFPAADGGQTFKGEKPQADQLAAVARTHAVKLVVLSIGGNDLGFSDVLTACVLAFLNPGGGPCHNAQEPVIRAALAKTEPKVERALRDIRSTMSRAGYGDGDYRLILQSYPSPIPTGAQNRYPETYARETSGGCPLYNSDSDWTRTSVVPRVAAMARTAARAQHAEFLDLQNSVDGHEACAKASRQATDQNNLAQPIASAHAEWIRFLSLGSQGTKQESLHPNKFGQRAFGTCLGRMWSAGVGDYACYNTPGMSDSAMYLRRI